MTSAAFRSNTSAAVLCLLLGACVVQTPPALDYPTYQATATNPAMQPVVDDPRLPRVLLIGDSISIGYTVPVRHLLKGVANVHRIPENGGPTTRGLAKLDEWLGTNQWDVIHFNWGLHDLKLESNGRHQVELDQYERNLERLVDRLQSTGATLIWATTTPVPQNVKGPQRDPADVLRYNEAARRVMDAAGVRINDLCAFTQPRIARIQIPQNVHFTTAGSAELARPVARKIREALSQRRRTGSGGVRSNAWPTRDALAARADWVKGHLGHHSRPPPFSFEFAGRPSAKLLQDWPRFRARRRPSCWALAQVNSITSSHSSER